MWPVPFVLPMRRIAGRLGVLPTTAANHIAPKALNPFSLTSRPFMPSWRASLSCESEKASYGTRYR